MVSSYNQAAGTLAATSTAMLAASATVAPNRIIDVILNNNNSVAETIDLYILLAGDSQRKIDHVVLKAGETHIISGVFLGYGDALYGAATDASQVSYVVQPVTGDTALTVSTQAADGGTKESESSGSVELLASVKTNVTSADTTFVPLTDLTLTLVAGHTYVGKLTLKCNNTTAAEGIKIDFDGGAATMTAFWAALAVQVGGTTVLGTKVSTAIATDLIASTITGETLIEVIISMKVNAGGTFIPRASENTTAAGTLTVEVGSWIDLDDVG